MRRDVSERTVAVLGATGATGRHVVARALETGHHVVALVRRPAALPPADGLREVVWPDVHEMATLTDALRGVDAVISALGGAEKGPTTVCTDAIRSTVAAMTVAGVGRLVAVSAYGVSETRDRSLYSRAVWRGVRERMQDKEAMEALVVDSALDWTLVRPPALKHAPASSAYRVGEDLPIRLWDAIGREDLAHFLVQEADGARYVRRFPRIRR